MNEPIKESLKYYKPLEQPRMYPLQLTENLHIVIWDETGKYTCSIAYFVCTSEGYELKFVGDRPMDSRVNWQHFEAIIRQGQTIADVRFQDEAT